MIRNYGWTGADATGAHAYLVRPVFAFLPRAPAKVLDLGCGNGFMAGLLRRAGHRVVGVDASPDGIAIAQRAYPDICFQVASIDQDLTGVVGKDFDVVLATEVIEHLYDPKQLLENAFRLLRAGGCVIITTPYHGYLKNLVLALSGRLDEHFKVTWVGGHIKFFSVRTLRDMAAGVGFSDLRFRFAGRVPLLSKSMILYGVRPPLADPS